MQVSFQKQASVVQSLNDKPVNVEAWVPKIEDIKNFDFYSLDNFFYSIVLHYLSQLLKYQAQNTFGENWLEEIEKACKLNSINDLAVCLQFHWLKFFDKEQWKQKNSLENAKIILRELKLEFFKIAKNHVNNPLKQIQKISLDYKKFCPKFVEFMIQVTEEKSKPDALKLCQFIAKLGTDFEEIDENLIEKYFQAVGETIVYGIAIKFENDKIGLHAKIRAIVQNLEYQTPEHLHNIFESDWELQAEYNQILEVTKDFESILEETTEGSIVSNYQLINALKQVGLKLGSFWMLDGNGNWFETRVSESDLDFFKMCIGYSKRDKSSLQSLRENIEKQISPLVREFVKNAEIVFRDCQSLYNLAGKSQ